MRSLTAFVLIALSACATGAQAAGPRSSATPAARAAGWDAASLRVIDGLVAKLRSAGKACADYTHWSQPLLTGDYARKGLPTPTAAAACTGDDAENLMFEVFADRATASRFVEAKRKLLCAAAVRGKVEFPGFPYVDGGSWIIEPDEQATAIELARVLGGTVKNAGCG